jgi:hypothetical protein
MLCFSKATSGKASAVGHIEGREHYQRELQRATTHRDVEICLLYMRLSLT